ncbi:MAG: GNAT family N-acetyltransferase [Pseudomonadota bacterium]
MKSHTKAFSELSLDELYQILALRNEVFVVEQACAYQDMDGKDRISNHLFYTTDGNEIAAYARILPPGISYPDVSIGRIVVASKYRKDKLGRKLVTNAIAICHACWPDESITIGAQSYLSTFYRSLGFEQVAEEYIEDGIPHIQMQLDRTH